ncbi:MAG TPA: hypothetical protein DD426_09685 [Clostridiaceae bacterium]|nr:hypothetical protein [Clostridiaceae bacterium]
MSSRLNGRRLNARQKKKTGKFMVDIPLIKSFIKYIAIISITILLISVFCFLISQKNEVVRVVYAIVIIINLIVVSGAYIALKFLKE